MNKQIFLLRDCYDREIICCGLVFNKDESIIAEDIQKNIDIIKYNFRKNGFDDWQFAEHNNEYLIICYYNLKEKYLRGQKDFTKEIWEKLDSFYQKKIKGEN